MTSIQEKNIAAKFRPDFPILRQQVNNKPLVYFDNAATSQKPLVVLNALDNYYKEHNANVHRGIHTLSTRATDAYEGVRDKIAEFINAESRQEVVFTRNGTEAINLVAYSWGLNNLQRGDEIILSVMEHHANLIPWQLISQKTGAVLKFVELTETEDFSLEHFKSLVSNKTRLVSVAHVSNTLGCINPIKEITTIAHHYGAKVLIDACQSMPHLPINVQAIDCDWLVATGHKMCGPTGSGFLYGKLNLLRAMPPFLGGGQMITDVFLDYATYADVPYKFESGTPAIAEVIGLGAALNYLSTIGMDKIHAYEQELITYLFQQLQQIPEIRVYGPQPRKEGKGRVALAAFSTLRVHPYDLSAILDQAGVALRAGHHCTQPLHRYLKVSSTARASLYFYNTHEEIDIFINALKEGIEFFDIRCI